MTRIVIIALLVGIYISAVNGPALSLGGSPIGVPAGSRARLGAPQARSSKPPRSPDAAAARAALDEVLEPNERVDLVAPAVGCTLVLTDLRLVVVRQGAAFRPKSGVKSWPLERELSLRIGVAHRETHRLSISGAGRSASVFVSAGQLDGVSAVIAEIRRRTYGDPDAGA